MRERAAFKSSVRIIRGAHLLRGYCSDNLSKARRCTTTKGYKDEKGGGGGGHVEGHVWQGRRNRYSLPGCQSARWSFDFTDLEDSQTGRFDIEKSKECLHLDASRTSIWQLYLFFYKSKFIINMLLQILIL